MSDVQTWSSTASSNNSAAPNGFPEGMPPSGVNDAAREVMAAVARYRADTDGVNTSSGTDTITLSASRTMTAYAQGDMYTFKAGGTNTGPATLNVDSLGAKAVQFNGTALAGGEIVSGLMYTVVYDGTQFQLINAASYPAIDITTLEVTNIKAKDGTAAASIANSTGKVTITSELSVDNLNLSGNTLSSTNANGNIAITPNGTGEVDISKVDIDSGTIDGTTIATSDITVGAGKTLNVSAGTLTLANDQISGDKVEGGTIAATTITTLTSTTGNITTVNATTVDTTNIEVTNLKAKDGTAAGSIADSTGVVTIASSVLTTTDINGGTVDGAVIGGASAAAGTFTTATATTGNITTVNATTVDTTNIEVTNIKAKDGTASIAIADSTGIPTFSQATIISVTDNTNAALRVTQLGTGNSFVVEDSTNPDATSFAIDNAGNVGIGTTAPATLLDIAATNTGLTSTTANNTLRFTDTDTTTANNQPLGKIEFYSADATTSARIGAYILATAQGASGGGNLEFATATNTGTVTEQMQLTGSGDLQFNSGYGSSATAYGCRAWLNFDGTGTPTIRGSGNITSITDNGVGEYTINFTTAFPDANYSIAGSSSGTDAAGSEHILFAVDGTFAVGSVKIRTSTGGGSAADLVNNSIQVVR